MTYSIKSRQLIKNINSDVLDMLCSNCSENIWQCWALVIYHLAMADNSFASPPFYRWFKILLKCDIYSRISTESTKYFVVFNNRY